MDRKRENKVGLTMVGLLFGTIAGVAVLGAVIGSQAPSAPPSDEERVQQALYQQYSCRASVRDIKFSTSDKHGSYYMAGCGLWFYGAFIDESTGKIDVTEIRVKWNGR